MRVLKIIPASYFCVVLVGFMGYVGLSITQVFCSLDSCNLRNTFDPLISLSQEKHYGAVYAPWAID